jgi:hypothetical protein
VNQAILFTGERIQVAVPQKAHIPFRLEIVQVLRERPELALEELDRMRVLHASIDGHLLACSLGLKSYARKLYIKADGDSSGQQKNQQQGKARLLRGSRAKRSAARSSS